MTDARGMGDILIPLGRLSRLWADYCRNWAKMAYYYNGLHGNVQLFTYLYPWPGNGAKVCEEKKRSRNEEGIFQY